MARLNTTVGQLLVNEALPEELRDYDRTLDKGGLRDLFREIATKHPEKYRDISQKYSVIGRRAAQESGGNSFGLRHLRKSKLAAKHRDGLRMKVQRILDDDKLTDKQRHDLIIKTVGKGQDEQIEKVYSEALKADNPLGYQVLSGSRGNPANLSSLLGSDMLYTDQRDRVIPLPVLRSYSEGLTPSEYWAAAYGTRKGVMATKFATRDAGFLSKQLNQVAHRLVVVDEPSSREKQTRGMPTDVDDVDNEGSLLASDTAGYKRHTVLTPKILKNIKRQGIDRILVRSPIIGGSPEGGVYARDVGVRERGGLPGRGEQVGLTAVQSLTEPLSQAQLSVRHSGGVAGQEKAFGGFSAIEQLVQVPKSFKGGAAHSSVDGTVDRILSAPAGGHYVVIGGEQHYVGDGFDINVSRGDKVEAGDVISEGLPNPAVVVKYKGIGEGRRYFVEAMRRTMQDAGIKANRRNLELLSRGLINHVRLTEERGAHVPDDVIPYSTLEHTYKPRETSQSLDPKRAVGKYLERPYLHYTIGTKVRPSMLKNFKEFGTGEIDVHDDPPPFEPEMIRGMYSLQHDPDWLTRMYGSGLKRGLLSATHHGSTSEELGTSFVPGLSRAVDFGQQGIVRTPEPPKMASSNGNGHDLLSLASRATHVKEAYGENPIRMKAPRKKKPTAMSQQPDAQHREATKTLTPPKSFLRQVVAGQRAAKPYDPPVTNPPRPQPPYKPPTPSAYGGTSPKQESTYGGTAPAPNPYSTPSASSGVGGNPYAYGYGSGVNQGLMNAPVIGQFMPQLMQQLGRRAPALMPFLYGAGMSPAWLSQLTYGSGKAPTMTPMYGAVGYDAQGKYDESRLFDPGFPKLGGFGGRPW